jgi:hypothetical protein
LPEAELVPCENFFFDEWTPANNGEQLLKLLSALRVIIFIQC